MSLRPYQESAIQRARDFIKAGRRRVLIQGPTGVGKTKMASGILEGVLANGGRVIWFSHSETLGNQAIEEFGEVTRLFSGDKTPEDYKVLVTMAKTLCNRRQDIPWPTVVIVDEAHHSAAKTYTDTLAAWRDIVVIGFTATPERLDGKPLWMYDAIVDLPSPRWFMDEGYLADYRYLAPPMNAEDLAALNSVKKVAGDFSKKGLAEFYDERPVLVGNAVGHYIAHALNTQALVFCTSVKMANQIAKAFFSEGIPAASLDGKMTRAERARVIEKFKSGATKVLTSCELIGEGFNIPSVETVILMRPTKSLTVYLQQIGRALRLKPNGSKAIILDMVGNVLTHSLPCIEREWSLEGKVKREKPASLIRTCESCLQVFENKQFNECPSDDSVPTDECGLIKAVNAERAMEEKAGELIEIQAWQARHPEWAGRRDLALLPFKECLSLAGRDMKKLHAVARAKGYAPGVVHHWMQRR